MRLPAVLFAAALPAAVLSAVAPFAADLALPAAAETAAERIAAATDIPLEEWTAMAMGRTLTYRIDGEFWALEHYYPGTNRVTLQLYDDTCLQGVWEYVAPHYCFYWDGEPPACFRHARLGDDILIIETRDGADTTMLQEMTGVSDIPFSCGPAVVG